MKKSVVMLILTIALFASGCAGKDAQVPQISPTAEAGSFAPEKTGQENSSTEQNDFPSSDVSSGLDDYMVSIEEQSDTIKAFLEHDALTQTDMNVKSQELYELWNDALNYLWSELKINLPEEKFAKLQDEQRIWITEKERALEEVGKEYEGGSIYPLVVNSEAAKMTEERVYELYDLLKPVS